MDRASRRGSLSPLRKIPVNGATQRNHGMLHHSWTLLGSRYIAEYEILRLREDRYRFEPTEAEADFIVCDTEDWVLAIPITVDRQVVSSASIAMALARRCWRSPAA